jgi:hypothetical protein
VPHDLHARPDASLRRATVVALASACQRTCTLLAVPSTTKCYTPRASTPTNAHLAHVCTSIKCHHPARPIVHHTIVVAISSTPHHRPLLFLTMAAVARPIGHPFLPAHRSWSITSPWNCSRKLTPSISLHWSVDAPCSCRYRSTHSVSNVVGIIQSFSTICDAPLTPSSECRTPSELLWTSLLVAVARTPWSTGAIHSPHRPSFHHAVVPLSLCDIPPLSRDGQS